MSCIKLQAYEWAVAHPDHVERIAAVCGAARCGELNGVFLRSIEEALKADAAWDASRGHFTTRPDRGLRAFGSIYAGWGVGAGWYTQRGYASAGFECAEAFVRVRERRLTRRWLAWPLTPRLLSRASPPRTRTCPPLPTATQTTCSLRFARGATPTSRDTREATWPPRSAASERACC